LVTKLQVIKEVAFEFTMNSSDLTQLLTPATSLLRELL